jgi:hypothetical protein
MTTKASIKVKPRLRAFARPQQKRRDRTEFEDAVEVFMAKD